MIQNKEIREYISNIKILLPVYSKSERLFIKQLSDNIGDYVDNNADVSMKDIIVQFGNPNEVVQNYIETMDTDKLIKRISSSKLIQRIFIIILITAVIGLVIFGTFCYKGYQYYKKTVVTEIETVIEDD
jgi:hypothetical protein